MNSLLKIPLKVRESTVLTITPLIDQCCLLRVSVASVVLFSLVASSLLHVLSV